VALVAVLVTRSMVDRVARAERDRQALTDRVREVEKMALVGRLARAERERQVLTDQVREVEKMALVGRLAASVSHEINNPLQIISEHAALVDELLADAADPATAAVDECRRSIRKIRDQVRRATAITRRLLGFSRAPGAERSRVDVSRAVEETIALLEADAGRHRIAVVRDYQPELAPVLADVTQLQQVFLNVLANAVDAIGEGGEIRVSTRSEGGSLWVRFLDTGPGLSGEARARLFEPFFTTKERGKGTGLGLYVSHAIAERLGGDLTAASRAEGGCAITLRLPADAERSAPAADGAATVPPPPPHGAAKESHA
jgi:two-component system NtrC family sensor kinase